MRDANLSLKYLTINNGGLTMGAISSNARKVYGMITRPMVISLGHKVYNTNHIVSFEKYTNPATLDIFIVLHLSNGESDSIKYINEEERTEAFKLLMSCFDW